ncbi:MAG: iron-sulfur cluster assembly accessory protein [Cytophagaceae bacterium]|nr:iron-sulfur cluster assembly accessory protein [Cytophagaceae bacterium]MDW8456876.1 iron-sulfur cluster assembly accessory protein [Cytophagaceae bacterium]
MTDELPFVISDAAVEEIVKIYNQKNIPSDMGLRIGIRGSGCSGVSYLLAFDVKSDNDKEFYIKHIPIYVDKKHFMYITGLHIDFINDEVQHGFVLENPDTQF